MKIWSLQALRFFAALGPVIYHTQSSIFSRTHEVGILGGRGGTFGQFGVDIFFVLSGVIIASIANGLSVKAFVVRRATRILPIYLSLTALYLLARSFSGTLEWRELVTSLTLWPALDRMTLPTVSVAWTLCFEVLFYAATALVIWKRQLIWLLAAVFLTALAVGSGPLCRFIGNPILLEFLMGVALVRAPRTRSAIALIPLGLALAWFSISKDHPLATHALDDPWIWRRVLDFGLPAAMVVWGVLQIQIRPNLLTYLGETSYALYLLHPPVVLATVWLLCRFTTLPPDVMTLTVVILSVFLAWRVHELIEKPMINWLRSPSSRMALARVTASTAP